MSSPARCLACQDLAMSEICGTPHTCGRQTASPPGADAVLPCGCGLWTFQWKPVLGWQR